MRGFLISLAVVLGLVISAPVVRAEVVWSDNFSDVSKWAVIFDPGSGSAIKSSNGLDGMQTGGHIYMGAMYVDKGSDQAYFAPGPAGANFIPFDPARKSEYTLKWNVAKLTNSVSWDIAVDEFDANKKYIDTVWGVYTASNEFGKEFSKNLGNKKWRADTRYIIPKIGIHTGDPGQTAYFSYISVEKSSK